MNNKNEFAHNMFQFFVVYFAKKIKKNKFS